MSKHALSKHTHANLSEHTCGIVILSNFSNFRMLYESKHTSKHTHEQAHTCKHTRTYGSLILSDALCNRILCNLCRVSRVSPPHAGGLRRSVPHLGCHLGPAEPPAGGGSSLAIVDQPRNLQPERLVERGGSPRAFCSTASLVNGCQLAPPKAWSALACRSSLFRQSGSGSGSGSSFAHR